MSSDDIQMEGIAASGILANEEAESSDAEEAPIRPVQPPRPIQRLDEAVVNRIAAGEIIHRPANALKELIENSLDAGADMIRITLKDGGLKMLQIQDNGCGIRSPDLPLLCERFATSKLREFSDLSKMLTFGFRGEALASISFVSASMAVVTKTKEEAVAYKAFYSSGEMVPPKPGQSADPKPCAGTDGTMITAQDLFYNVPQRRRALRSAAEEYNRALEVAGNYALHYGSKGVGFVCKKSGSNTADLSTPASPSTKTIDTIRLLHGASVARELVHLPLYRDDELGFTVQGWISGANWSAKRTTFLCFINNRLVDCSSLKRSLEALYSSMLPRGGHPWVYLSLELEPDRVDVNVHPTKREVHFLGEEEIIERVCTAAQDALAGANSSRTFQYTQAFLPGASQPTAGPSRTASDGADGGSQAAVARAPNPRQMIRVDAKERTLESMFTQRGDYRGDAVSSDPPQSSSQEGVISRTNSSGAASGPGPGSRTSSRRNKSRIEASDCTLTSIQGLRSSIAQQRHLAATEIVQEHVFVGVVDPQRPLSLLQHGTKLYLINHDAFIEEYAYQLSLRQFGSLARLPLTNPVPLKELVALGVDEASDGNEAEEKTGLSRDQIASRVTRHLMARAEMLSEYWSLGIDAEAGTVTYLPALLPGQDVFPAENLPSFLLRLGTQVDWTEEKACFESFARELAYAHVLRPVPVAVPDADVAAGADADSDLEREQEKQRWKIQHVWLAYMASKSGGFVPSKKLVKEDNLLQIASLHDLYRVFERC